jgi:Tol biopolymer transport system component
VALCRLAPVRKLLRLAVPSALAALVLVAAASGISRGADGRIVFVTNHLCGGRALDCGRAEIATVRSDGTGSTILTRNGLSEATPAWSPNGAQIAFFRPVRRGSAGQIWLMDASGAHQRQLTHLKGIQYYGELAWAPAGRSLVIDAFPSAVGGWTDLWLVSASTGAASRLTSTPLSEGAPSWAPNGRWIAFFSEGRRLPNRIWRLSLATKRLVQLTSGNPAALYPSWSPDSRRIAFTLGGHLAVMDADGSHRHVLNLFGTRPHWSSDGQWLVYATNGDLFKVRTNGSDRVRLTHHGKQVVNDQPDW